MSLLGYDSFGTETINGLNNLNCNTLYSDTIYIDNSTTPINVNDKLNELQAEINAIETGLIGIANGYYGIFGSTNNASNPLVEKNFYFNQTIATNGFSITGGTGLSATRITATYAGFYSIYYKANYQKINATIAYEVRTWLMKNGTDLNYSTTLHTFSTTAQSQQISGQYTVQLAAGDYLEVAWLSTNASASSDILDSIGAVAPYPQLAGMFASITQVSNTTSGRSDIITVGSTATLAAGSSAYVTDTTTINPTYTEHTLAFGIPKGEKGDTGAPGAKGDKGDKGNTGATGAKGDTGDTNATAVAALATAIAAEVTAIAASVAAASAIAANSAQDALIATNTADIATDEARITTLEVKTQDQSWGTFTGTTFSRRIQVTNTDILTPGTNAVYLGSSDASTFLYGLSSNDDISISSTKKLTTNSIQSSDATANINIGTTLTTGDINLGASGGATGVALNWGGSSNSGQLTFQGGSFNLASTGNYTQSCGGTNTTNISIGQSSGIMSIGTLATRSGAININTGATSTAPVNISSLTTNNAPITIGSTASTTQTIGINGITTVAGTTNINTGTFFNTSIGSGAVGGNLTVNTAINTITGTTNTLTSTGETEINSALLDINATSITMDSTSTTILTSVGETEINSGALDINASSGISIDTPSTFTVTTASNIVMNSDLNINLNANYLLSEINLTTTGDGSNINLNSANEIFLLSERLLDIRTINTADGEIVIDSAKNLNIDTVTDISLTAGTTIGLNGTAIDLTSTTGIIDINAETALNLRSDTNNIGLTTISATGDINLTSGRDINFSLNTTGGIANFTSNKDQDIVRIFNSGAGGFDSKLLIGSSTQGFRTTVNNNSYANLNGLGQTQVNLSTNNAQINLTAGGIAGKLTLTSSLDEVEINSVALDMNATGAITMDTTTTTTLTSTGETEINCAALDVNATGAITMDTDDPITITSTANGIALSSFGEQDITCGSLDINSNGTITIDSVSNNTITSGGNLNLVSTINDVDINGIVKINTTNTKATSIGNATGALALTGSINTILGTTNINRTNALATNIGNSGALTLNGSSYSCITTGNQTVTSTTGDLSFTKTGATGGIQFTSANYVSIDATDEFLFNAGGLCELVSSGGKIVIQANKDLDLTARNFTFNSLHSGTTYNGYKFTSNGDAIDFIFENPTTSSTNIQIGSATEGMTIDVFDDNLASLSAKATTQIQLITAGGNINFVSANTANSMLFRFGATPTTKVTISDGGTTFAHPVTMSSTCNMNHDFLLQQSTYPPTSTSAIGYTNTKTATINPMSNTLAERMNFTIPSKGVWLIIGQLYWATNTSNTVLSKEAVISTTSGTGGSTAAAYGLVYYDEINDAAGAAEKRQHLNINGVYTATAATTLYCNARCEVNSGTNVIFNISASWTRIG